MKLKNFCYDAPGPVLYCNSELTQKHGPVCPSPEWSQASFSEFLFLCFYGSHSLSVSWLSGAIIFLSPAFRLPMALPGPLGGSCLYIAI